MALDPLFQGITNKHKLAVPLFNLLLKRLLERREIHSLCCNDVLIKHGHSIIEACNEVSGSCLKLGQHEVAIFPVTLHFCERLLNVELLIGTLSYLFAKLNVREHI